MRNNDSDFSIKITPLTTVRIYYHYSPTISIPTGNVVSVKQSWAIYLFFQ
jgi:hypothetical protein